MAKTIFITGASRGFSRIWTEAFLKRGYNVVAAIRNPETLTELTKDFSSNLWVLKLDVTDKKASFDAVETAKTHFGRIDVLINNAGYRHIGAVEELNEQDVRAQLETSVLGSLWTIQAVITKKPELFCVNPNISRVIFNHSPNLIISHSF